VKLKLRSDLEFIPRLTSQGQIWIVKDPIGFTHFLFSKPEFQLAKFFDGRNSEEEILLLWRRQFKSESLTLEQVKQFAFRLIRDNLVTGDRMGFGLLHGELASKPKAARWINLLSAPLVIRLRGSNPYFFLRHTSGLGRVLFHPVVIILNLLVALSLIFYLLGHFEEVNQRLPTISQLLSKQSIISLIITMAIIKVIHEIGHALACQRYGGECFEIGLIFLAMVPTLYCNVSDAWTFPERWKRIMVSAAGIYFEIILATLAAVAWFCTPPGLLNAMFFNVVLLCSVNTILINGNPLLRYDGYYILSDWFDRPNLATDAKLAVGNFVNGCYRRSLKSVEVNGWLLGFGLASNLYRWFILISIGTTIFLVAKSFGFPFAGYLMFLLIMVSSVIQMIMQRKQFKAQQLWGSLHPLKATISCLAALAVAGFFFCVPLPTYVFCNAVVELQEPWVVYAPMDGKLAYLHPPYRTVKKGTELARLSNQKLAFQIKQTELELTRLAEQTAQMKLQANEDPSLVATINLLKSNEEKARSELRLLKREAGKLIIHAPLDGMVYPAKQLSRRLEKRFNPLNGEGLQVETWTKNYLVPRGEELLTLATPDAIQINLFIGDREVDLVAPGQAVFVAFDQHPNKVFQGQLGEVYREGVDVSADPKLFDVGLESVVDAQGQIQTLQTPYRATVVTDDIQDPVFPGSRGSTKIRVRSQTLAEKFGRFINRIMDTQL